jgi:hypothetical protein
LKKKVPNVWYHLIEHIEKNGGYYQIDVEPKQFNQAEFEKGIKEGPIDTTSKK